MFIGLWKGKWLRKIILKKCLNYAGIELHWSK